MNFKNDNSKNISIKPKLVLRRSASSTGFGQQSSPISNLRVTKSYTGIMVLNKESKSTQMITDANCGEICKDDDYSDNRVIETLDLCTNEMVFFKESLLNHQGKIYPLKLISNKWKKDCRMWLWKNKQDRTNMGDLCNVSLVTHVK